MEENPPEFIITKWKEYNEKKLPVVTITRSWKGNKTMDVLFLNFFPKFDELILRCLKDTRPQFLLFLEHMTKKIRYIEPSRTEQWEEQEEVGGIIRKIDYVYIEKKGMCKLG